MPEMTSLHYQMTQMHDLYFQPIIYILPRWLLKTYAWLVTGLQCPDLSSTLSCHVIFIFDTFVFVNYFKIYIDIGK